MINTFIFINVCVVILNPVFKSSAWAALDRNWRNAITETRPTAATATVYGNDNGYDTWQPVIQSQNWLITTAATAPASLTSSQHPERESFSLMIQRQRQQQHPHLSNRYYVYNHHNGNYTKKQISPLSSTSMESDQSSTGAVAAAAAATTIKLKPYVATTSKDTNNNVYRRYNHIKHFPLVENPYVHHQNTVSKDMMDTANQAEQQRMADASKHLRPDVNRHSQHPYQDNSMSSDMIDSRLTNIPAKMATTTGTGTSATTVSKDTFTVTKMNLLDEATTLNGSDEENINEILLPLHAALDKVKQFCDIVKDIITNTDDEDEDGSESDDNDVGAIQADETTDEKDLSNEDGNDDNDLTISNFAPVLAAVNMLLMKKPLPSTPSSSYSLPTPLEEVQGHERQTDRGTPRDSLVSLPTTRTASAMATYKQAPSSETITPRVFTDQSSALSSSWHADTLQSPRMKKTIKKLAFFGGHKRKLKKKFKKKFKKILFPLLLAYKLKFLALIPLLIGGLTLLVGSTGLAGFFFALFAAVMTMKSGHGHRSFVFKTT